MRSPLPSSLKLRVVQIVVVGVFSFAGTSCSSSSSRSASDSTLASSEAPVESTIVATETVADTIAETVVNAVDAVDGADGAEDEYAIDGLPLGLSGDELQSKIGSAPTSKSDLTLEGASGEYVTSWEFEGVEAKLSATAQDLPVTLRALTITSPSALKTKEGIGIGASEAEVNSTYGSKVNTEESSPDKIVIGSVFGGMIFTIDNGTVSEIFVGAAAE
jgi:hypothetical protein